MEGAWERRAEEERRRRALRAAAERLVMAAELRDWERFTPAPAPVVFEDAGGFRLPTGTPFIRPIEDQPTVEEFAAQMRPAGQLVSDIAFGPEVESVLPGEQEAGLLERFVRTQAGEQEFRTSAERFGEGRPGAGVGWGLLGLAAAIPLFGDIAQGAAGVSRAARGAGAAGDAGRASRVLPDEYLSAIPEVRREFAQAAFERGYGELPSVVRSADIPGSEYQDLNRYIPIYRGIRGGVVTRGTDIGSVVDAEDAAFEFINGRMYLGGGTAGPGTYFTMSPTFAEDFAIGTPGRYSFEPGVVIRAYIPVDSKILDLTDGWPDWFRGSGDGHTEAVRRGYDAIKYDTNYVVLNRSALTVVDEPRPVSAVGFRPRLRDPKRFRDARQGGEAGDVARASDVVRAWDNIVSPETRRIVGTDLRSVGVGDEAVMTVVSDAGQPRLQRVTRSETAAPPDPDKAIWGSPDSRLRPLLPVGEPTAPTHLYRVMSLEEFEEARRRGFIQSAGLGNIDPSEGTVFSLRPTGGFYAPESGSGVIVRVRYDDADGWFVGPEGASYVKTQARVPFERVDAFESFGEAGDVARGAERAADVGRSSGFSEIVAPVNEIDQALSDIASSDSILSSVIDQPFMRSVGPNDDMKWFDSSVDMPPNSRDALEYYVSLSVGDDIADPDVLDIINRASGEIIVARPVEDFMDAALNVVKNAKEIDEVFWPSQIIPTDVNNEVLVRGIANAMKRRAELFANAHNEILASRVSDELEALGYQRVDIQYGNNLSNIAESLQRMEPDLQPTITVYRDVFLDILGDREFLAQYATGDSNGLYDPMYRFHEEISKIGVDPARSDRPIYGYLGTHNWNSDAADLATSEMLGNGYSVFFGAAGQYGDINIVFDRSVLERSTFTIGDSLGQDLYAIPASRLSSITPAEVRLAGGGNTSVPTLPDTVEYLELQITNPRIEDIKEILVDVIETDLGPEGAVPLELSEYLSEVGSFMQSITGKPANITVVVNRREGGQLLRKYDLATGRLVFQ